MLHALKLYNVKSALLLLNNGADCSGSINGSDALQLVIDCRDRIDNATFLEIIQKLIDHGYNTNKILENVLIYSSLNGFLSSEIIRLAIRCGANPNYISTHQSLTPLSLAIWYKDQNAVKVLLEAGANINQEVWWCGGEKKSPLSLAILAGNTEIIEILARHGAIH